MDFDQLRKDMEDGTEGPWVAEMRHPTNACIEVFTDQSCRWGVATIYCAPEDDPTQPMHKDDAWGDLPARDANARRIARVPDLERIAMAAEKYRKARSAFFKDCQKGNSDTTEAGQTYMLARAELFAILTSKDAT